MKKKKHAGIFLDKIGMCTSVICIIHCMAIPLLFIFGFESLLIAIDQEWIEVSIIITSLIIGLSSFIGGFVKHRQHYVPILFVAGFLLIVNGESVVQTWLAVVLSITGGMVIAYAHYCNLKLKRNAAIH